MKFKKKIFGDNDHPKEEKNAFGPKSASVVSPLLLTYVVSYMGTDRMASIHTGSQGHGIFLISALVMELFSSDALGQQKKPEGKCIVNILEKIFQRTKQHPGRTWAARMGHRMCVQRSLETDPDRSLWTWLNI